MPPHARHRPPSGAHHGQQARQAVEGAVRLGEPMPGHSWLERLWGWPSSVMVVCLLRHLTGQPAGLLYRQERALIGIGIGVGTGSPAEPLAPSHRCTRKQLHAALSTSDRCSGACETWSCLRLAIISFTVLAACRKLQALPPFSSSPRC